jgi:hypothetical protein
VPEKKFIWNLAQIVRLFCPSSICRSRLKTETGENVTCLSLNLRFPPHFRIWTVRTWATKVSVELRDCRCVIVCPDDAMPKPKLVLHTSCTRFDEILTKERASSLLPSFVNWEPAYLRSCDSVKVSWICWVARRGETMEGCEHTYILLLGHNNNNNNNYHITYQVYRALYYLIIRNDFVSLRNPSEGEGIHMALHTETCKSSNSRAILAWSHSEAMERGPHTCERLIRMLEDYCWAHERHRFRFLMFGCVVGNGKRAS